MDTLQTESDHDTKIEIKSETSDMNNRHEPGGGKGLNNDVIKMEIKTEPMDDCGASSEVSTIIKGIFLFFKFFLFCSCCYLSAWHCTSFCKGCNLI